VKILVIRQDNIGDLVLTTPVFSALRHAFPRASIEALVNSYNAAVLGGHPCVDRVHVYTKGKHRAARSSAFLGWTGRLRQIMELRARRFDFVIVAAPGFQPRQVLFARWLRPRHIVAFVPPGARIAGVDHPVEHAGPDGCHHVEDTFRIVGPLGIVGTPPPMRICAARPTARKKGATPVIAVHVSSRKATNRWPQERFVQLLRELNARSVTRLRLFWSPGDACNPLHPGDDERARRIADAVGASAVEPIITRNLEDLINGLAECDLLICSDGGAMHLAAALGKPIVCIFGMTPASHWRPWGVPYRMLQHRTRSVSEISVAEAVTAYLALAAEAGVTDS
jgi:heptosyltransferase-3